MSIHPTAIVAAGAQVPASCTVGPYCTIGPNAVLGESCELISHVVLEGHITLGSGNRISPFACLGVAPQDLKYANEPTAVRIGDNNTEYSYLPSRTRVKQGTQVTFTNVGDLPHTASATAGMEGKWDTGTLAKGESKTITFDQLGSYYYVCTPHPWMYGQIIVEP